MRIIDADAVPIIGISDYNVMLQKTLDAQPTVDLWKYPAKGEYPTESGEYFVLIKGLNGSLRPHIFNYYADIKRWSFDVVPICWQYIIPPKEEA